MSMCTFKRCVLVLVFFIALSRSAPIISECELSCGDSQCVLATDRCDNINDCENGADEVDCHYLHECPKGQFMCRTGECVAPESKCNGTSECSDGSDERNCRAVPVLINLPSAEEIEHHESHTELVAPRKLTTQSPVQMKCERNDSTLYSTSDDGAIYQTRLAEGGEYKTKLFAKKPIEYGAIRTLSVGYPRRELFYVADKLSTEIHIIDEDSTDRVLLRDVLRRFSCVAKDWVTGNIYFAEDGFGLGVCIEEKKVLNGVELVCVKIVDEPSVPYSLRYRDLIVHPKRGLMMWIQDEPEGVLKIAGMDGVKVRTLSGFERVHAIAFDYESERLYVAEGDEVDVIDVRTLRRTQFATITPSAMAIYGCELFYVDRTSHQLKKFVDGQSDVVVSLLSGHRFLLVIAGDNGTIGHEVDTNPCAEANCPEFCTLAESAMQTSARCLCTVCAEEETTEIDQGALSSVITFVILTVLILSTVAFAVLYYRCFPALNDQLEQLLIDGTRDEELIERNLSADSNNSPFKQ